MGQDSNKKSAHTRCLELLSCSNEEIKALLSKNAEQLLYYAAFVVLVYSAFMKTSMIPFSVEFSIFFTSLSAVLIAAKIIFFGLIRRRSSAAKTVLYILLTALCVVVYFNSQRAYPLPLVLITVGAENVPFKKIAKLYSWLSLTLLVITVLLSLCGVIENLQYETELGLRNSFGICYPTDFAAHVFFTMAAFAAVYKEKLGYLHCAAGAAVCAVVYIFCKTRTDCLCMLLLCAGAAVIKLFRKLDPQNKPFRIVKNICRYICIFSLPLAAALMTALTVLYDSSSVFWNTFDRFLTGRLALGKKGFMDYPLTFLGQQVEMLGNGGSTVKFDFYFYLDCSYIYSLLIFGVIFTVLLIAAYVLIGFKYRNDEMFLFVIALTSLNCMIAHHLPDCAYCIFTAALFAEGGSGAPNMFRKNGGTDNRKNPSEQIDDPLVRTKAVGETAPDEQYGEER